MYSKLIISLIIMKIAQSVDKKNNKRNGVILSPHDYYFLNHNKITKIVKENIGFFKFNYKMSLNV